MQQRVLVTGAAGFIGFHVAQRLLADGCEVVGIDNLCDYYSVQLKRDRLDEILPHDGFEFIEADIANREQIASIFEQGSFQHVIHLAAQAGVRYSIEAPQAYIDSNLVGFGNILEGCRHSDVEHLVYASSSSVYGANTQLPYSTSDPVNHPVSLYAATKRSNELMAHSYSHLFQLPTTGLRFFTVYGPWGRPDMAIFLFTDAILADRPIRVFNHGKLSRDFTYIDDVVNSVVEVSRRPPQPTTDEAAAHSPATSNGPFRLFNVGNHQPVELMHLIRTLENCLGRKAILEMEEMQPGDVFATYADTQDLVDCTGVHVSTPIETGLQSFVDWHLAYHGTK